MVDNYMNGELVILTEPKKDGNRENNGFGNREYQPNGRQFNNNSSSDNFHASYAKAKSGHGNGNGSEDIDQLNALLSQEAF